MFMPPHSNSPYTGVHQPSPYSPILAVPNPPESLVAATGWRTPADQSYEMEYFDPGVAEEDREDHEITLINGDTVIPTVWTDDDVIRHDVEKDGLMVDKLAVGTMYAGKLTGAGLTPSGVGMGEIRATPLPSGHRVEEVTLEVPVTHSKLTYALEAVESVINSRRAFGYTIPEESCTVTTVGNEIVIRWEEHS